MGDRRMARSGPVLQFSIRLVLALALLAILQGVWPSAPARAATNRVIDVDSIDDDKPGTGCTLREAITAANLGRGPGIDLLTGCKISETGSGPPLSYHLNLPNYKYRLTGAAGEDDNASGDLDIRRNLTLRGMGVDKTMIIGNGVDRVLHIAPVPADKRIVARPQFEACDIGAYEWD